MLVINLVDKFVMIVKATLLFTKLDTGSAYFIPFLILAVTVQVITLATCKKPLVLQGAPKERIAVWTLLDLVQFVIYGPLDDW